MALEQYVNSGNTTTTGTVDGTSDPVTVAVTDATVFPGSGNFRIKIDSEILLVTAVSGNNLTCTRAVDGTTIASHSSGVAVKFVLTKSSLANIIGEFNIYDSYSNLPGASVKGRRFHLTPGYGVYFRDNGSSWDLWFNDYGPFNPNTSDFTTHVNFGTRGSVSTTHGFVQLKDAGPGSSTENVMGCFKTAPSTPWTMTLAFREHNGGAYNANAGIMIRDSSSGRVKGFARSPAAQSIFVWNWTNPTTFQGTALNITGSWSRDINFLKLTNDGTNLLFYISSNWNDWYKVYSEAVSGNYIATIDQVGYYINMLTSADSNNCPYGVDIFHAATS